MSLPLMMAGKSGEGSVPWYLAGGLTLANVLALWEFKGAASQAEAYLRLAGAAGYANLDPTVTGVGVAPSWSAAGMAFNGSTQFLSLGLVPTHPSSFAIKFNSVPVPSEAPIMSVKDGSSLYGLWASTGSNFLVYQYSSNVFQAGGIASGVVVVTPLNAYLNGSLDVAMTGDTAMGALPLYIGARNNAGVADKFSVSVIEGMAFYDINIDSAAVALSIAMADYFS